MSGLCDVSLGCKDKIGWRRAHPGLFAAGISAMESYQGYPTSPCICENNKLAIGSSRSADIGAVVVVSEWQLDGDTYWPGFLAPPPPILNNYRWRLGKWLCEVECDLRCCIASTDGHFRD